MRWQRLGIYWEALKGNLTVLPFDVYNALLWVLLPNRKFFDPSVVPNLGVLPANWATIRGELDELVANHELPSSVDLDKGQIRLAAPGAWRMFFFRVFGIDVPENQRLCPRTWEVLREIPGLYSAMFSVLEPGQRLALHTGPTKGTYRVHLGMVVPEPDRCWLEVAGERRHWHEGELMVFDEGYPHRAVNEGDQRRVALVLDVIRDMPWPWLARLNHWVLRRMTRLRRWQEGARRTVVY
ncbi:MAG: aspartyl/asparaginyl beta-hydroxylase domain-containing protein [Acidimicrobiales bacterium]|nr:aspartyl/asparaginyl beta-hydroxylase domain-containing protein [Acidimicrobiales bacterium]